jgi:hypothetical protein
LGGLPFAVSAKGGLFVLVLSLPLKGGILSPTMEHAWEKANQAPAAGPPALKVFDRDQ